MAPAVRAKVQGRACDLITRTQNSGEVNVVVTVRDSGIGLDPATREQIFTAFHTTKPGGLGMGLSISRYGRMPNLRLRGQKGQRVCASQYPLGSAATKGRFGPKFSMRMYLAM